MSAGAGLAGAGRAARMRVARCATRPTAAADQVQPTGSTAPRPPGRAGTPADGSTPATVGEGRVPRRDVRPGSPDPSGGATTAARPIGVAGAVQRVVVEQPRVPARGESVIRAAPATTGDHERPRRVVHDRGPAATGTSEQAATASAAGPAGPAAEAKAPEQASSADEDLELGPRARGEVADHIGGPTARLAQADASRVRHNGSARPPDRLEGHPTDPGRNRVELHGAGRGERRGHRRRRCGQRPHDRARGQSDHPDHRPPYQLPPNDQASHACPLDGNVPRTLQA